MSWPVASDTLQALGAEVAAAAGVGVSATVDYGDLCLAAPAARVVQVLRLLRDQFGFQQLTDLTGSGAKDAEFKEQSSSPAAGSDNKPG